MEDIGNEKQKYRELLLKRARGQWWSIREDGLITAFMILETLLFILAFCIFFVSRDNSGGLFVSMISLIGVNSIRNISYISRTKVQVESLIELIGEENLLKKDEKN